VIFRQVSLKIFLSIVFGIFTLLMVFFVSFFVFSKWESSSHKMTESLLKDNNELLSSSIKEFLDIPVWINELKVKEIESRIIDFSNEKFRDPFFASIFYSGIPFLYSFSAGLETGEYYGARKNQGNIEIMRSDISTGFQSWYYKITPGLLAGELSQKFSFFDPRTRDWYQDAVREGKTTYSQVYKHFVMYDLALTCATPFYDKSKNLLGVIGLHFPLAKLNQLLLKYSKDFNSRIYIIDKNTGEMVANSDKKKNFNEKEDKTLKGILVKDFKDDCVLNSYLKYSNNNINSFHCSYNGNEFSYISSFQYFGLDWRIIFINNKLHIYDEIRLVFYDVLILSLFSVLFSIIFFILLVERAFSSLKKLMEVTVHFSKGAYGERFGGTQWQEINLLGNSFNEMALKIENSLEDLQIKVKERTLELEKAYLDMKESNKAKGSFLAQLSHEIRTPLNGVLGFAQLLEQTTLTDIQESYLKKINLSAKNLLDILNDILDFSRIESGELLLDEKEFLLLDILEDCFQMISYSLVLKNLEFHKIFSIDENLMVYGDKTRLKQVILNILNNAVKFTKEGYVCFYASFDKEKNAFDFKIQDTGIGMTLDDMSKIFIPFSQARSTIFKEFGGTGLGLSICRRLVEKMGGRIEVQSEKGVGSCFFWSLPLKKKDVMLKE